MGEPVGEAGQGRTSSPGPLAPVLQAKLRPAVNPDYLVPRPRLDALLDEAVTAPLTLVVAPAGSGKTSLLRSWFDGAGVPRAWLSLDDSDQDPVQLWSGIVAALEGVAPGCTEAASPLLRRSDRLTEAVGALLDDLECRDLDTRVLVIDDLQLVDEVEAIRTSLGIFVQHLPSWLHVVVATRRAPRLPLHRLRARGQLGEVRFAQLRFSFDEATAMLHRLAPALPSDRVRDVAAQAGGWAASIQLAALAARADRAQAVIDLPAHPGGSPGLRDYVWQEVLAGEPPDVVDVLVATAVVDRIDPGLAQLLAGRTDAPQLLALAEERGLFTTRTEPWGSFEVHALVREVLVSVAARDDEARVAGLHALSAGWYEEHGQVAAALEHWLLAGRPREALRLLSAEVAPLYDSGRESTVLRTIAAIPEGVATTDVTAMLEYAWCHLLVDHARFLRQIDYVTAWARDDANLDATHTGRLLVLRAIAATVRGGWGDSTALLARALELLGPAWMVDPLGKFAWNMAAREVALSERWHETGGEVRAIQQALSVTPERRLGFEGVRALGAALAGLPVDALRTVAGARSAPGVMDMTILRTELAIAEAVATREIGDAAAALPLLLEIARARVDPVPYARLLALLELVQVRIDEADLAVAVEVFGQASEVVDTELPGQGSRDRLARAGVALALALHEVEDARRWASQLHDPFWSGLCTAQILLAVDDAGAAADVLRAVEPRCVRHRVLVGLFLARSSTDREDAERHLGAAVQSAVAHGLVQTVASAGAPTVEAVERQAWQVPQPWLDRLRRAATPRADGTAGHAAELIASLTERELAVLRLLPSRLTLREIADELLISVNTLKFHLKVVYRKLGCGSRAEAAELARAQSGLRVRA